MSILITGGSGSFGQAFVNAALRGYVERICVYSRGEHAQAAMRDQYPSEERLRFFIGDIRDRDRLRRAMEGVDTVIHAAALKRIEVGHYNPGEMVKTNIMGAMNVIEAAQDAHVMNVVALSSDKAYQPISPYGHSKALSEALFLSTKSKWTKFSVTRYGNVAGSAGSVIPKWKEILETSDTVPVTDPDCTRFWMTMDEAVKLVSDTIGKDGELAIPELPAYTLRDLAEAMGAKMNVLGLGDWEKKHESMRPGLSSDSVRQMSVQELKEGISAL